MLTYNYDQRNGAYLSSEELQRNPLEPEKWLIPAYSTILEPPSFMAGQQICRFDGEKWIVEDIPGENPEPVLSEEEKSYKQAANIRLQRDILLNESDKYMLDDFPVTEEKREQYKNYRQYLRDLPNAEGFPYIPVKTFEEWQQV